MMKQIISCLLVLACIVTMFAGCQKEPLDAQTTAPETDTTAPPTLANLDIDPSKDTEPKPTKPSVPTYPLNEDGLPEYVPGTIWLDDQDTYEFPFERKYRVIYYTWTEMELEMLTEDQRNDFSDWFYNDYRINTEFGKNQEEMTLVTIIKRYSIPREVFEAAVNEKIAKNQELGIRMTSEWNEVPNVDIIYTFDNEIINNFYRYE